jgi:hypothetical protein
MHPVVHEVSKKQSPNSQRIDHLLFTIHHLLVQISLAFAAGVVDVDDF